MRSRTRRASLAALAALGALAGAYALGAYSQAKELWPISLLRDLKREIEHQPHAIIRFDSFGRLLAFPGKRAVACPAQTGRTAVLAIFGGSNAGNYTGQRVASQSGGHVLNYLDGKCYPASSPLLGADNTMGEYWTTLGDMLIAGGLYDNVVISVTAVGSSVAADWAPGGRLAPLIRHTLADLQKTYRPTRVIWDMGEDDALQAHDPKKFVADYARIIRSIRRDGVDAPVYTTLATKCMPDDYPWSPDNPIALAEKKLPGEIAGLTLGVDRDALMKTLDRRDDCHLGGTGAAKNAQAWFERFRADSGS